jgi:hypothetical protein
MELNINEVITNMANAIKGSLSEDWSSVKNDVASFLTNRKNRLELLAKARIKGKIDDEFFLEILNDEKDMLVSELHSYALISKVMAQNATNAAIEVLNSAIKALVRL